MTGKLITELQRSLNYTDVEMANLFNIRTRYYRNLQRQKGWIENNKIADIYNRLVFNPPMPRNTPKHVRKSVTKDFGSIYKLMPNSEFESMEHDMYLIKTVTKFPGSPAILRFFAEAKRASKIAIMIYKSRTNRKEYTIIKVILGKRIIEMTQGTLEFPFLHKTKIIAQYELLRNVHKYKISVMIVCNEYAVMDYGDFLKIMKDNDYI